MEELLPSEKELLTNGNGLVQFPLSILENYTNLKASDFHLEKVSDVDRAISIIENWLMVGRGFIDYAQAAIKKHKEKAPMDGINKVVNLLCNSSREVAGLAQKVAAWLKDNHHTTLWGLFREINEFCSEMCKAIEDILDILQPTDLRTHPLGIILQHTFAIEVNIGSCWPYYTDYPVTTDQAQGEPAKAKGEHQRKVNNREAFEKITGSQSYKAIMAGLVSDGKLSRAHDGKYNYNNDGAEYRADHVRALIKILYDKFGKTPCFDIWDSVFSKKSFAHGNIREGVTTNVNKDIEAYWKKTDNGKIL